MKKLSILVTFLLAVTSCLYASLEENFILVSDSEVVHSFGVGLDDRVTPCSTFKVALCLMGFDSNILLSDEAPIWNFQEGYSEYLPSWKAPQTPRSWITYSCLWYSQLIAEQLGMEKIQGYLRDFDYGNQDMSGGLTTAWLSSSLKISPKEQVHFIRKMLDGSLPVSHHSLQTTKELLFLEELPNSWKLFGKTGFDRLENDLEVRWLVGWVEKEGAVYPFAYNVQGEKTDREQAISRVKQLLGL
ncbi:MAG: penicillin-binding transpeptidase domain-containing protein [Chlamydiales bacterium]|nr:penicillin-binding transpeptidase domain-containing protein [Chlamydiales bacterium]